VPGTIRSLLQGERPVIRSDGSPIRDYLYVQDAAEAYVQLAERLDDPALHGQAWNLSLEQPVCVLELVRTIQALMGRLDLEPIILGQAPHEIRAQYLSAAKARAGLGWMPAYTLQQGLEATIAWYRQRLAAPFGRPTPG
jgi:CDP-glucose 4,6-dehydratase